VLIHGGVSYAPYRHVVEEWQGRPLARVEVYPASEGFVAVQTERQGGLTLMLDYSIFYEFVPAEDLGSARPRRHTVADLELTSRTGPPLRAPAPPAQPVGEVGRGPSRPLPLTQRPAATVIS
jgi:hypothetical protein